MMRTMQGVDLRRLVQDPVPPAKELSGSPLMRETFARSDTQLVAVVRIAEELR